ncbi:PREDICTED: exportin-2-like [Camelina sativa]|uniref:Exportin-2-like n=1 Tax=Camelina sativa TaxID=90675 RepID=A0ABM0ZBA5_CAMSA|nr:PREDICTED: exportin-2-like [Camelina sativa]
MEEFENLASYLLSTLSSDPEVRRSAEKLLSDASGVPGYGLNLLRVIATESLNEHARHAGSIFFKNYLRWLDGLASPISDSDKEQAMIAIVSLMESPLSSRIKIQLNEAATIVIGNSDCLKSWPTFIPCLISQVHKAAEAQDYASVNVFLGTADSIFRRFRHDEMMNEDELLRLKYCHEKFYDQLIQLFKKTNSLIKTLSSPTVIVVLIESLRLCCCVFFSFNFRVLPAVFTEHMKDILTQFHNYLSSPRLVLGICIDDLLVETVANINLLMEKHERQHFAGYVSYFGRTILTLVANLSTSPISEDELVTGGMRFVTSVSRSGHHVMLSEDNVIKDICRVIVIPNMILTTEDERIFERNYMEFIHRDLDASGSRRRIASELLNGLASNYEMQVHGVVVHELQKIHSCFSENPTARWRSKVCLIDLVIALDNDVLRLAFQRIILSDLLEHISSEPMLMAGSLKFLAMYAGHVRKPIGIKLFEILTQLLQEKSNVVHSYAARCIEKLVLVKEENGESRYLAGDFHAELIITNLFAALKLAGSEENHYVMKCIMLVLGVSEISTESTGSYILALTSMLTEVFCRSSKNPLFKEFVFESISVLLQRVIEETVAYTPAFEEFLFPTLKMIIDKEITESMTYAHKLINQLLLLNRPTLSYWIRLWQQST